jgi:diguanylate cyclase (GGDEF)-like protein/PAS domain S-box-containing protein
MRPGGIERGLADRLFDGLLQIDSKGRITCWNRAAERITGYPPGRMLGQPYKQAPVRHVDENGAALTDSLIPLLLTAQDGRPRDTIAYFNHSDGYPLRTLTRTEPICDVLGRAAGALEIFTDNKAIISAFQAGQHTDETVHFDSLTGIGNRPHIEARIRAAISDFRLRKRPFGVLFIDIDHFKDFNDAYGHLLGDKILKMTATTLRQNLRGSDSCGRWGGEEFIALAYDLDASGLAKVAEKLRESVAATNLRQNAQSLGVTISIGATLVQPEDTFQTLVERADQLMYESKRQGRNRVTLDCTEQPAC